MSSTGDAGHEAGAAVYSATQRHALLAIARASIEHGLERGRPLPVSLDGLEPALTSPRATFVTLKRRGALRGCIGTLRAELPLARDVAERAYAAAFRDPRFPPVTRAEWSRPGFTLSVSVLSPPTPMRARDEADALRQLRPGVDGIILSEGPYRGTFLPSVWEQLPEPREFLEQLKRKAGLPRGHWSPRVELARYTSESFGGPVTPSA
ncbi:MAG: AmmeMemoRadiSam system protein A [Myxococcales bacterium]|nr:AmmeMemoRadiSam system protein A [Myxococcales bacterium]